MQKRWQLETEVAPAESVDVVLMGIGPIGVEVGKLVLQKGALRLIGAVDVDPEKAGRDLGSVLGLGRELGIPVVDDAGKLSLPASSARVALHTTSSHLQDVIPQLTQLLEWGMNVVSSTEELSCPRLRSPALTAKLDELARAKDLTVLGTGVNPGYAMDAWAIYLTAACKEVQKVRVRRVVDAGTRREPLQRKVGAGMAPSDFEAALQTDRMGHIGLLESLVMVASRLGFAIDSIDEHVEPAVATEEISTAFLTVEKGQVLGLKQTARGLLGGEELVTLALHMYIGAPNPADMVQVIGVPNLAAEVSGGFPGDLATPALLVNAIPRVVAAPAGVTSVDELPLLSVLPERRVRLTLRPA